MARHPDPNNADSGRFPSTHWSLIVRAGSPGSPQDHSALAELFSAYWYPIYAFIRRQGNGPDQALDLTQGYFTRLLEKSLIAAADRHKGRFRAFLRTDCRHFLIDQHRRTTARGGGLPTISIDARTAEDRYRSEPVDSLTPDRLFDRALALTLLDHVLDLLARVYAEKDNSELFDGLKLVLTHGKRSVSSAASPPSSA
jgi:DNA-directed RNA polymerase specialized sigma24 family protein